MRKSKNRYFHHIFVFPGDAPEAITLNIVWMEREFDAYKLSCCMCRSNYYRFWDTARYLWKKSSFYHTPLHSTPPFGGFPSECRHPLSGGKATMVSLPDGEKISKICLFVLTWSTNVTDGQTDTAWQQRPRLCIASRGKNDIANKSKNMSRKLQYASLHATNDVKHVKYSSQITI